jgi:hypothetical protein
MASPISCALLPQASSAFSCKALQPSLAKPSITKINPPRQSVSFSAQFHHLQETTITKPKPAGTLIQAWAADRVHPAITNPEHRPKMPLNPIAVPHHRPPLTVTTDLTASSSDQIDVVPLHVCRRHHPSCCSSLSPTHPSICYQHGLKIRNEKNQKLLGTVQEEE